MTVMEMNTMESLQNFCNKFKLRDYFAGQALAGLGEYLIQNRDSLDDVADTCYRLTDAMIERSKK